MVVTQVAGPTALLDCSHPCGPADVVDVSAQRPRQGAVHMWHRHGRLVRGQVGDIRQCELEIVGSFTRFRRVTLTARVKVRVRSLTLRASSRTTGSARPSAPSRLRPVLHSPVGFGGGPPSDTADHAAFLTCLAVPSLPDSRRRAN